MKRKSLFIIECKGLWYVEGWGWMTLDYYNRLDPRPSASSNFSESRTLKGALRTFNKLPSSCKLTALYRRKKGWIQKWEIEK